MNATFEGGVLIMPQKVSENLLICLVMKILPVFCCIFSCLKFNFYIFTTVNLSKTCSVDKNGVASEENKKQPHSCNCLRKNVFALCS